MPGHTLSGGGRARREKIVVEIAAPAPSASASSTAAANADVAADGPRPPVLAEAVRPRARLPLAAVPRIAAGKLDVPRRALLPPRIPVHRCPDGDRGRHSRSVAEPAGDDEVDEDYGGGGEGDVAAAQSHSARGADIGRQEFAEGVGKDGDRSGRNFDRDMECSREGCRVEGLIGSPDDDAGRLDFHSLHGQLHE